ncbi:MAG: hypothetical protein ACR2PR_04885 [Pseudohongiellaceae bacterium]
MENSDFDNFINEINKVKKKESQVDWSARREEWLEYLSVLYNKVEVFLQPYVESGKITLEEKSVKLNEEYIGSYDATALDLFMGNIQITLTPVGTSNIIGARGRVDMRGPRGTVKFVLVPEGSSRVNIRMDIREKSVSEQQTSKPVDNWEWKISTRPPVISFIKLEEESFQTALLEVANG